MPAINLKDYIPVHERIEAFRLDYPNGRIITEIHTIDIQTGFVLFRAEVYTNAEDDRPIATGHAFEIKGQGGPVNQTSHIENGETSAIGRALAIAGYEVKRGIVSREEMEKVVRMTAEQKPAKETRPVDFRSKVYAKITGATKLQDRPVIKLEVDKFKNELYYLLADGETIESIRKKVNVAPEKPVPIECLVDIKKEGNGWRVTELYPFEVV